MKAGQPKPFEFETPVEEPLSQSVVYDPNWSFGYRISISKKFRTKPLEQEQQACFLETTVVTSGGYPRYPAKRHLSEI